MKCKVCGYDMCSFSAYEEAGDVFVQSKCWQCGALFNALLFIEHFQQIAGPKTYHGEVARKEGNQDA